VIVRRALTTLTAVLVGAAVLAVVPVGLLPAQGEGEPTLAVSVTEGRTGTTIDVSGTGCFLPDGITGADGLLFQLIAPDSTLAASATLPVERDGTWSAPFVVPNGTPAATYSVKGVCIAPMYEDLGILAAGTFTVTGEGPRVATTESAPIEAAGDIEPYPAYDGQSTCSPAAKPGMVAFRDIVMRAYPTTTSYGISRDCGIGGTSEHKEGRAWDWANDATTPAGRARVAGFMNWLFRTDQYGNRHANARRLGLMYIIWNRQIFKLYRPSDGWTPYTGSSPHTDHVHFSLTRAGGNGSTSWYTAPPDPCRGQTHRPFCDVSPQHQFRADIMWVADNDIANGYADTTFRPLSGVSRQAMAAFLYRLRGVSYTPRATGQTFTDVARSSPFFREIEWLRSAGIGDGYADGRFLPLSTVSRQAMSAFLYRAAREPTYNPPPNPEFNDVAVGRPFYKEIHWLDARGISTGYSDGSFRPDAAVSRQAMAAFLKRLDPLV